MLCWSLAMAGEAGRSTGGLRTGTYIKVLFTLTIMKSDSGGITYVHIGCSPTST